MVTVELVPSIASELQRLRDHLRRVPDVHIVDVPGIPRPGEQGVLDTLQVSAPVSGALLLAIRTLPALIKSCRSDLAVTIRVGSNDIREITVTAANADDAVRLVEKALDG